MSTKTTFKRVALVAVAALGLSLVAVAPSNAAVLQAGFRTLGFQSPAATGTVGVELKAVLKQTGSCVEHNTNSNTASSYATVQMDVAPVGTNLVSNSVIADAGTPTGYTNSNATTTRSTPDGWNGYRYVAQADCTAASSPLTGYSTIRFTPDIAGTYVIVAVPLGSTTGAATWTVTVANPVVQSMKAFLNTDTTTATTADATSLSYAAASSVTAKGAVVVQQYSTTDTTTVATTAISQAVTVSISKGLVSKTNDFFAGAKSVSTAAAAATAGRSEYYVFANGEVGSATLTVTVGALTSTKTITFQGVAATLSAALTAGQPTFIAPTGTTTVTVTAKDSAGNAAIALPTMTVTSATTTVATATIASGVVTITGVAAGTSVITIADSATTAPATSATYTVTVAPAASATLPTLTFDKAEYMPGELMTITIGAQAADNASFAAFTAAPTVSVNVITTTNPFTSGAVALVGGKATWKAYAPITPGPVVITATSSTGSSATAAAVTATATVISDGVAQAAVDAAAEAIDAANAATDAANAAAEAADAATAAAQDAADAVAALSVAVTAQIDALKAQNDALRKQLIALTNLIIKIQKKVKA